MSHLAGHRFAVIVQERLLLLAILEFELGFLSLVGIELDLSQQGVRKGGQGERDTRRRGGALDTR
jgi:hypothetical protein